MSRTYFPFVGRELFLNALLRLWEDHRVFSIHGVRAVGKSRTVKEFLNRVVDQHTDTYVQVIDSNLRQATTLNRLYIKIITELKLSVPPAEEKDDLVEFLVSYLAHETETLFVFLLEDAEDVESFVLDDIKMFVSLLIVRCSNVRILLTSTTVLSLDGYVPDHVVLELPPMHHVDAVKLLMTVEKKSTYGEHIDRIAQLCEGLPLALLMTGETLIGLSPCEYKQYY